MQTHLNSCPVCQAEVRELEPVVAALADADPDRIDEHPWPPGYLEELTLAPILGEIHRARRRGRRFRWSALAAAALCLVVIGLAGFARFLEPAVPLEPLSFSGVAPGVERVEGNLIAHASGTEIRLAASGLRDGQTYRVTLVSEDGERVGSGTFIGAGDKPVRGTFNAALLRKDAAKLEVRTPGGGEPVFSAKLPEEPRVAGRDSPLFGILPRGILPWADQDHQTETPGASGPESRMGSSAEDPAPADTQEKPKPTGSGGGTTHKGSSPESDVKGPSSGGEPSASATASAAASPTASASASGGGTPAAPAAPSPEDQAPAESPSASGGGTPVIPAAPPPKDQAPAESQYGGGKSQYGGAN